MNPSSPSPLPHVYVFDLDGVVYRGAQVVPGAAEAIARLRARTQPYPALVRYLTNNSMQTRAEYVAKLAGMGIAAAEDEIVTSSSATAAYIAQTFGTAGKVALVVGGAGIRDELARIDVRVVRSDEAEAENGAFDFLVVGLDRNFVYDTLLRAQQALFRGARFIATNRDGQFPVEGGRLTPGAGAMVAAIAASADAEPVVIGKPETAGLQTILTAANVSPIEAVMIGDRLDTDVWCGNRLGVPTVLVLTGITDRAKAAEQVARRPEWTPGAILKTLHELR